MVIAILLIVDLPYDLASHPLQRTTEVFRRMGMRVIAYIHDAGVVIVVH